jgi:hypothetical protein
MALCTVFANCANAHQGSARMDVTRLVRTHITTSELIPPQELVTGESTLQA